MDIHDLIKFENENTSLDFKATQYIKEKFESLIKDIMAMANSNVPGDKYIIVGVKHRSNGDRELLGIESSEFIDSAIYQQVILENVEPDIQFEYLPHEFEGKVFGVFKISNCIDRPYMMKKDYKNLRKGDCLIRKGSQQSRMERRDFDQIVESRTTKSDFERVVHLYFKGFDKMKAIELASVSLPKLPSEKAKERIIRILKQKRSEPEDKRSLGGIRSFAAFTNPFGGTPYESRSIEELEKNLENVEATYLPDDCYEVFELNSIKFNIMISNDGQSYLEDCSIKVIVKKIPGLLLASEMYDKPEHDYTKLLQANYGSMETIMYPDVESTEDYWIITQKIGDIRHQIPTTAFEVDLRMVPTAKTIGQTIEFECTLFGKNLTAPLQQTLKITVIEPKEEQ